MIEFEFLLLALRCLFVALPLRTEFNIPDYAMHCYIALSAQVERLSDGVQFCAHDIF